MASSPSFRLALFDMDDVVYAYCRADRIAVLAEATGLDRDFIERRIWLEGLEFTADGGAFADAERYLAAWSAQLGQAISEETWVRARGAGMTPIAGTLALIDRLMAAGVTVAVLTNNGPLIERHRHRLAPALAERVGERFLVSYVFGMAKPAPDIYRLALDRLGFRPEETVFIDDLAENVAGAEAAGLRGHVFRTPAGLADYFAALGLA
jgi:putative hydrolase of the HAD superfamily